MGIKVLLAFSNVLLTHTYAAINVMIAVMISVRIKVITNVIATAASVDNESIVEAHDYVTE